MARPRNAVQSEVVALKLYLRPGEDDDLIAFFERYPSGARLRAIMVKAALRGAGLDVARDVDDDLFDEVADAFDDRTW